MALFFKYRDITLSEALANIGELKTVIADALRKKGFTDVVTTSSEVAGNRSGVRVSILHLLIGGSRFWQVIMAGGNVGETTQRTVDEVLSMIKKLKFL